MMRILWVNNSSMLCGGTLQCTLSMIKSFPDCDHTILVLSGRVTDECRRVFGPTVSFVEGGRPFDVGLDVEPDLIVYQNTGIESIPNASPHGCPAFYYLHSAHRTHKQAMDRFHHKAIVSEYLKGVVELDAPVLHQPVHVPEALAGKRVNDEFVIGRICTPKDSKWKDADVLPLLEACSNKLAKARVCWWFVGMPERMKSHVAMLVSRHPNQRVMHNDACYAARSVLHCWHVMLYDTSIKETFGRTVREAQRCGCIPVVRMIGGFVEQFDAVKETGYSFQSHDEAASLVFNAYQLNKYNTDQYIKLQEQIKQHGDEHGSLTNFRTRFLELLA